MRPWFDALDTWGGIWPEVGVMIVVAVLFGWWLRREIAYRRWRSLRTPQRDRKENA